MEPSNTDPVRCYELQAIRADLESGAATVELPQAAPVLLLGADTPLSEALTEVLAAEGYLVRRLLPGAATRRLDAQRHEVDFSCPEGIAAWRDTAHFDASRGVILINLMGCDDAAPAAHLGDARALFLLLKAMAAELHAAGAAGAGWLLNATRLDGQFGLSRSRPLAVGSAGTLGVAKTAAREWPALRVRCVDAAPGLAPQWLALQLLRELRSADGEIEIGYTEAGRWRLGLRDQPPVSATALAALAPVLEPGAVLLVTGGAYGITADVACALAAAYRPKLVLLGRSALPGAEDSHTRDIGDAATLQQALIGRMRAGDPAITPAQVNGALKRILKERRIRANLAAMRAGGAEVEYHCLDARDGAALGRLIDDVHARHGRIDGVLHGAGVIGDKLIVDKTPQGFDAVYDTKVAPALVLADKLRPEELRFIAFFSSVAGRYGNPGQCDYSAANEVLNKLADDLSHRWPGVHALAINWGPWDAGMVDPGLRRLYAARAIQPIAVDEGRRQFMRALSGGARGAPELVISASVRQIAALAR